MQTGFSPHFRLLLRLLVLPHGSSDLTTIKAGTNSIAGEWHTFAHLLNRHRVTRRAVQALFAAGVTVPDWLAGDAQAKAMRAMEQIAEADCIQTALSEHDIPMLVLKGPVLSQALYGDPVLRESKDLDILVSKQNFGRALTILGSQLGLKSPTTPPVDSARFPIWLDGNKDAALDSPRGVQVELHHRLTAARRLLPVIGLEDATDQVVIGSKSFAQFDRANLFVYLCVHGAASRWHRLTWLADVYAMLAEAGEAELMEWHDHAKRHGVERCTLSAMMLCERLWALPLPDAIIRAASADGFVERIVENSLVTLTDTAHLPATARGRAYISNALILRAGWKYQLSVIKERVLERDLVGEVSLPHALRFLYLPLRLVTWMKRKAGALIRGA